MGRVEMDDRLRPRDQLLFVGRRSEVGRPEVADRDLAWSIGLDPDPGTGRIGDLDPTDVGVAAALLGPDVRDVLVGDR